MTTSRTGIGAAVLTLSGLAVLGLQAPASAAPDQPGRPDNPACAKGQHYAPKQSGCVNNGMSVGHRNIHPGESQTVTIRGFKAGTTVRVNYDGRTVGTAVMDRASYAKVTFTVPANARKGRHTVVAFGTAWNGQATSLALEIKVVGNAKSTTPSTSGTAATTELHATNAAAQTSTGGGSTELMALGAAGVLLMGAGPTTLRIMRRRSDS